MSREQTVAKTGLRMKKLTMKSLSAAHPFLDDGLLEDPISVTADQHSLLSCGPREL